MANTITTSFQKLRENLEITGLQKNTVSTRQDNVRDVVADEMDIYFTFFFNWLLC